MPGGEGPAGGRLGGDGGTGKVGGGLGVGEGEGPAGLGGGEDHGQGVLWLDVAAAGAQELEAGGEDPEAVEERGVDAKAPELWKPEDFFFRELGTNSSGS